MGILFFQLIIFGIIFISSYSSRKTLDITVVVIFIFTILAVFTSWLMLLQFATIIVSYLFALDKMSLHKEKVTIPKNVVMQKTSNKLANNSGCLTFTTLFIIIMACLYAYNVWSVKNSNNEVSTPTLLVEPPIETFNDSNDYESYDYDTISYEEPVSEYDTINSFNENYYIDDEQYQNEYDDDYGYDNDYGDSERNRNAIKGIKRYGKYKFIRDVNCDIENANLEISRSGVDFDFHLQVENKHHIGEISGRAIMQDNRTRAVFKSSNCESITFDFLSNGLVSISEVNCRDYHGTNICFNSLFK